MMWGMNAKKDYKDQGWRSTGEKKLKQNARRCHMAPNMSEGGHRSPDSVNMVSWYSQQLSHHFAM